jgi:hypothetical protein
MKKILVKQGLVISRKVTKKGQILDRPAQLPYATSKPTTKKDTHETYRSGSLAPPSNGSSMTNKKKPRTKSKVSNRSEKLKPMTKEELTQVIQKFKPLATDKPRNSKPNITQETEHEKSDSENNLKSLKTMPISEASSNSKLDSSKDIYLTDMHQVDSSKSLILYEEEHKKTVKPEKPGKTGDNEASLPKEESSFFITYESEHKPIDNPPASTQAKVAEDFPKSDSIVDEEVLSEELEEVE